jgi:hypothetical protein
LVFLAELQAGLIGPNPPLVRRTQVQKKQENRGLSCVGVCVRCKDGRRCVRLRPVNNISAGNEAPCPGLHKGVVQLHNLLAGFMQPGGGGAHEDRRESAARSLEVRPPRGPVTCYR